MKKYEMRKKIKILYLIPAEGFGGAERQALFHITNLPDHGFDVITVTGPGRKVYDVLTDIGRLVYCCSFLPREYGKPLNIFTGILHAVSSITAWIRSALFLKSVIDKEQPDLLFAGRVAGWTLAAPLSRLCGIPAIWRSGSCAHGRLRRGMLLPLGFLFPPEAVIANCKAVADSVGPLINAPFFIVPNGVDDRFLQHRTPDDDIRRRTGLPPSIPIVGLALRPSPDKGMHFLSEVVNIVNLHGKRIHFCIAGEFGWRKTIQTDFAKKGLTGSVTFLGHVDDIASFYMGCDIIALTSRNRSIEGFPNSLLEAMALGKPVIATAAGGIPELVDNGVTGIVVHDAHPQAFAHELLRLADDPAVQVRIGAAARALVIKNYSSDSILRIFSKCINAIICKQSFGADAFRYGRKYPGHRTGASSMNAADKATVSIICGILMLLSTGPSPNCRAESLDVTPPVAGAVWPGRPEPETDCSRTVIPPDAFIKVQELSGDDNYYSIEPDGDGGSMIRANYIPPGKTVKLGYRFPDDGTKVKRLAWDWRIITPPRGSFEHIRGKNDSGAAIYLLFKDKLRTLTIKYVYSESLPAGKTFSKDSFLPTSKMQVVVASTMTNAQLGHWVHIEVDVESDFKRLYISEHCPPLKGIGIMSDGDETYSRVMADYRNFNSCMEK